MLALKHNDDRFFDELTIQGKTVLNDYIMNHLYREDSAMINLKGLPQSTENHWNYDNIDNIEYHSSYNFMHRNHTNNKFRDMRVSILKKAFTLIKKDAIILSTGDAKNKKAFFQIIYPTIKFHENTLSETYKIYYSYTPKIIISNYLDNRTIGLKNLSLLFDFIVDFNKPKIKTSSVKLF